MTQLELYKAARRGDPFRVPEGYFGQAACRIMERIRACAPQRETPAMRVVRWMPYVAAACIAALALALPGVVEATRQGGTGGADAPRHTAEQQFYHEADYVYDYLTAADTSLPSDYENDR